MFVANICNIKNSFPPSLTPSFTHRYFLLFSLLFLFRLISWVGTFERIRRVLQFVQKKEILVVDHIICIIVCERYFSWLIIRSIPVKIYFSFVTTIRKYTWSTIGIFNDLSKFVCLLAPIILQMNLGNLMIETRKPELMTMWKIRQLQTNQIITSVSCITIR